MAGEPAEGEAVGKLWGALGAMTLAVVLAGCWPHGGHDAGRSHWNPAERGLTAATVGELEELWRTPVHPGSSSGEPASVAGSLYVPGSHGRLARVDAATGEVVWRRTLDAGVAPEPPGLGSPVWFRGAVRVTWACCRSGVHGTFWVSAATGADADAPPGATGGVFDPAVADGALAGLTVGEIGITTVSWGDLAVTAVAGEEGQPANQFAIAGGMIHWAYGATAQAFSECRPQDDWHHPCVPDWRTDLGAVPGPPAAVGRHAVAYPVGSEVVVLDVATGAVRWRADLGARVGRLVVAGSTILAPTDADEVVALPASGCGGEAETCTALWRAPVGGLRDLAAGGDVAYATTDGGQVVALAVGGCRAATCAPLAEVDVGGALSPPVVDGGRVVVGDAAGTLVALGLPERP